MPLLSLRATADLGPRQIDRPQCETSHCGLFVSEDGELHAADLSSMAEGLSTTRLLVDAVMRWSRRLGATSRLTAGEVGKRFISMGRATEPKMTPEIDVVSWSRYSGWVRSRKPSLISQSSLLLSPLSSRVAWGIPAYLELSINATDN